jgi:thioredoxin 1
MTRKETIMSDAMQHADDGAVHLTAATFDEALAGSPGPTLVDFWAPWCGPCKAIAPMIDDLARELSGRATVGKVNVEDEPALAVRFSVMALPALMFFKGDQTAETLVGAVPKAVLLERLQALGG